MTSPEFQKVRETLHPDSVANIEAEGFEALLFYSFKAFFNSYKFEGSKNITVIQGWCRNWTTLQPQPKKGPGDEHDLIVIDGNNKIIILFEAKISLSNEKTIYKAKSQLLQQREYFHKHHGHVLSPDWKIVTVISCKILPQSPPCSKCELFLLGTSGLSNLNDWWQQIASKLNTLRNAETTQENRQGVNFTNILCAPFSYESTQLFCTYILALYFFGTRILAQNCS